MAEEIDHLSGLPLGLGSHAARHHAPDRHLLPEQHAQLIGGVVHGRVGDMGHETDEVEAGIVGGLDISGDLERSCIAGSRGGRQHHDALGEQTHPIDRQFPVAHLDRAEGGAHGAVVVDLPVDHELASEVVEWLFPERVWPPEIGLRDVDRPLDSVLSYRSWMPEFVVDPGDAGTQGDRPTVWMVEDASQREARLRRVGIDAHDPEMLDGGCAGVFDGDRPPHPSGVVAGCPGEVWVEDGAHEIGTLVRIAEGRHGHVDCDEVVVAVAHEVSDLESVGNEIAVGVADIGTVEPDVSLLGQPVECDPAPASGLDGLHLEVVSEQNGALVGEAGGVGPVAGHLNLGPVAVVECGLVKRSPQLLAGGCRSPDAGQLHPRTLPRQVAVRTIWESRRRAARVRPMSTPETPAAETIGALRASGWESIPLRQELRRNAIERIRNDEPLFPQVLGYESTVNPQLENALLAGHDIIFLGERGQAKTRMIRGLTDLLDEWMPIVAGSEINDDPYHPISQHARELIAEHGDDTPITWVHRDDRFGEKLATPDTSIADLIGEVDPIKVAEGRYLSDELTLHYGLVPRTNRGIFAMNELPDLSERIQVGLLNVLEERDVQIRGHRVRLPLDVILVASANPEDYTNRGRLITPLKDRFGSQIRTHYPLDVETEVAIIEQEADTSLFEGLGVSEGFDLSVPSFMTEIVASITHAARRSQHIAQRSGVSVRLSISNFEIMIANAVRRALRAGETTAAPRIVDLEALPASTSGKVEIETLDEGRDGEILAGLVKAGVLQVFKDRVPPDTHRAVVDAFDGELIVDAGEDVTDAAYVALMEKVPALSAPVEALLAGEDDAASPAMVASACELVLEGLHLAKRLNKDSAGGRAQFRGRS